MPVGLQRSIPITTDYRTATGSGHPALPSDKPAPSVGHAGPGELARTQRRAVKKIAAAIENDRKNLRGVGVFSRDVEKLDSMLARLESNRQQLAALQSARLDATAPTPTFMRSARSGAMLAGAMASRAGAIVTASAVGVGEGGAVALAAPVLGIVGGAANGFVSGWRLPVFVAKPLTAVGGMGLGAVSGGVSGAFSAVVAAPVAVALPGSLTRKSFRLLDQLPTARARAAQKKMSTRAIAAAASTALVSVSEKAGEKREEVAFFAAGPRMISDMIEGMTSGNLRGGVR